MLKDRMINLHVHKKLEVASIAEMRRWLKGLIMYIGGIRHTRILIWNYSTGIKPRWTWIEAVKKDMLVIKLQGDDH